MVLVVGIGRNRTGVHMAERERERLEREAGVMACSHPCRAIEGSGGRRTTRRAPSQLPPAYVVRTQYMAPKYGAFCWQNGFTAQEQWQIRTRPGLDVVYTNYVHLYGPTRASVGKRGLVVDPVVD